MAHHSDDGKKRPRKSEADRPTKKARTQTVVDILAKDEKKVLPYFGEGKCSVKTAKGAPCGKIAYYALRGQTAVCGRHKGKEKGEWRTLRKNPNAETERADAYAAHMETVLAAQAENKAAGKRGTVTCIQLPFRRRPPPPIPGVEDIRPNYADANVKGARGLARLSPKSMGPVGEVLNLENFHQSNKVRPPFCTGGGDMKIDARVRALELSLPSFVASRDAVMSAMVEIDALLDAQPPPTDAFYQLQKDMQADPKPYRHQGEFVAAHPDEYETVHGAATHSSASKNIPLYSVHNGQRYCYVQSRQFYCTEYEKLALPEAEYKQLLEDVENGRNVRICGYDGFAPTHSIDWHYLDSSVPFGHELVLYTMLTVTDAATYPWLVYRHRYDATE